MDSLSPLTVEKKTPAFDQAPLPGHPGPDRGNEAAGSCVINVLSFQASVAGPAHVLRELRALFPGAPFRAISTAPIATTSLVVTCDAGELLWEITQDYTVHYTVPRESLLAYLEWMINVAAVSHLRSRYLLLHAGAVAYRGAGLVLCAGSGGGKSTLTAGLVAAGFEYLSDEIAAVDPENLWLLPYPRSICVKEGSRSVLLPHYRQLGLDKPRHRIGGEVVWFLRPPANLWRTNPVPVRYMIFPSFIEGANTELTELPRSTAVEYAVKQSFTGSSLGEKSVATIVRLAQGASCFKLTVGSLPEAVATLKSLVDD